MRRNDLRHFDRDAVEIDDADERDTTAAEWECMAMTSAGLTDKITHDLRNILRGKVISREDQDYNQARQLYNAMIDKRPKVIARCIDVADVIAVVNSELRTPTPNAYCGPRRRP